MHILRKILPASLFFIVVGIFIFTLTSFTQTAFGNFWDDSGLGGIFKTDGKILGGVFKVADIQNVASAELVKENVLRHKTSNQMYPKAHFDKIPGKIYRNIKTGQYYSENQIEEVRGVQGLFNRKTGEVFVAQDFDESVEDIFQNTSAGYYASKKDHVDNLNQAVEHLKKFIEGKDKQQYHSPWDEKPSYPWGGRSSR